MFCPNCGQQQLSIETRFCSKCGFLMTSVAELLAKGGVLPEFLNAGKPKKPTPRKKGLRQGGLLFLSGFLIVPLLAIITSPMLWVARYVVPIAAILTFLAGFLRMVYALIFESSDPNDIYLEDQIKDVSQKFLNKKSPQSLPPELTVPANFYAPPAGNWNNTNELVEPHSIVEQTTRFFDLEKENKKS